MRPRRVLVGCASLALAAGCGGPAFEPETGSGGSSSRGAGGDGVGGLASCGADGFCAPAPEGGWDGPVAVYIGASPPSTCPAPWTALRPAHAGQPQLDAKCAPCTCGAAPMPECGGAELLVYDQQSCTSTGTLVSLETGVCNSAMFGASARVNAIAVMPGNCEPQGGEVMATASWEAEVVVCSGADLSACGEGGGLCAPEPPAPFDRSLCVTHDGDQTCPPAYTKKTLVHEQAEVSATCATCECTHAKGASCKGEIAAYTASNCTGSSPIEVPLDGTCGDQAGGYGYKASLEPDAAGACEASGGEASGSASPKGAITLCCKEL